MCSKESNLFRAVGKVAVFFRRLMAVPAKFHKFVSYCRDTSCVSALLGSADSLLFKRTLAVMVVTVFTVLSFAACGVNDDVAQATETQRKILDVSSAQNEMHPDNRPEAAPKAAGPDPAAAHQETPAFPATQNEPVPDTRSAVAPEATSAEPVSPEAVQPEPESSSAPPEAPVPDSYGLVWLVPPTLEHSHIYYCSHCDFFALDDHSGRLIDRETGNVLGEDNPWGGHGGAGRWVYDPQLRLFGIQSYGGLSLFPFDELLDHFPRLLGLMAVEQADSSLRYIPDNPEFRSGWLVEEAFSGKFAVMHAGRFVTDFIFDGHERFANRGRGTIALRMDGNWGLIDENGDVAAPFIFEHIVPIDDNTAFAKLGGLYGILDIRFMQ